MVWATTKETVVQMTNFCGPKTAVPDAFSKTTGARTTKDKIGAA